MAKGNPLLLAWTDDTLRSYELSGAAFVQIGTSALAVNAGSVPFLTFMRDGQYVGTSRRSAANNVMFAGFMPTLASLAFANVPPGNVEAALGVNLAASVLGMIPVSSNVLSQRRMSAAGAFGGGTDSASTVLDFPSVGTVNCIGYSPDGDALIVGKASGNESYLLPRTGDDANGMPVYGSSFALPVSTSVNGDVVAWGADSRIFSIGDKSGNVFVFRRDEGTAYLVAEISDALGHPVAMAWSPSTRYLAVSFQTAGTPTTVIYRRTGNSFQKMQTLEDTFGYLLGFTADGNLLLDGETRRAFSYSEGVFTEASGILDNLPAGVIAQAISPHIVLPTGTGRLYDGAISAIVQGNVDLENLKIALLSVDAVFDQTDASLDDVTASGANEVVGNGWPQGGKILPNVALSESSSSTLSLTADPVTQTIIEDTLSFRYAVIYDATASGGRPISFIDFQAAQHAEKNTDMKIEFSEFGFVLFSS